MKKYDVIGFEIYSEGIPVPFQECEICKKKIRYMINNVDKKNKHQWLKFFKKRPELGMYTDYRMYCHGLCFWKQKLQINLK